MECVVMLFLFYIEFYLLRKMEYIFVFNKKPCKNLCGASSSPLVGITANFAHTANERKLTRYVKFNMVRAAWFKQIDALYIPRTSLMGIVREM